MTHAELQNALPDYLAGTLADVERRTLEQHFEVCDECADLAESWQAIVPALRTNGAVIFEAHPEPSRLRKLAQGSGAEDRDVAAHVASCPSCALELGTWGGAPVAESGGSAAVARPKGGVSSRAWWGVAATLAATALLIMAWRGNRVAPTPGTAPEWSGAPRLLILEGAERSDAEPIRLELEDGQPYAVLVAQPVLPVSIADGQSVRFSLAAGDGREVWGVELPADEIRNRLRSEGAVMLLISRRVLPAGVASLRALSNGERFWEVSFEIGPQRQSPDATKAPQ